MAKWKHETRQQTDISTWKLILLSFSLKKKATSKTFDRHTTEKTGTKKKKIDFTLQQLVLVK
jgi:hypothetical protein